MAKSIGAAEAKTHLLRLLKEIEKTREPVTITHRGKPLAQLVAVRQTDRQPLFGALKGTVLKYERPFDPACDPEDWNAIRGEEGDIS